MKKIKKLTFSEMSKKQLDEKQLKTIKGGDYCTDNVVLAALSLAVCILDGNLFSSNI